MTDKDTRLREDVVSERLEELDWPGLNVHLAPLILDENSAAKLADLVLRARRLVFRYPGNLKKRKAILDGVVSKIRADLGDEFADSTATRFDAFALIDEGYTGLRAMIEQLPLAGLSQAEQVSAYLDHVAREWCSLRERVKAAQGTDSPGISGVTLETPEGQRYGADAMASLLVTVLGMNITLAAYKAHWFDTAELIKIPVMPIATEEQAKAARAADGTAVGWQQWQRIEERFRYLGGTLEKRDASDGEQLPIGAQVIVHEPAVVEWELWDTIANERLGDRLSQTFIEMATMTNMLDKPAGIDPGAAMPPSGYVSAQEIHSSVLLSEYLATNVVTHQADLGGLKLSEWMRGFAVLQVLAEARSEAASEPMDRAFPRFTFSELEAILQSNGLIGTKASIFIDHASFAKSSRDVYDAPILRGDGDWCLLASPALCDALLIRLVLSTLANKKLDVEGKGEDFEEQFRTVLRAQGLPVYHFEVRRGGETYEYDAIVPWGAYLFVFECKNRALSGTNPIATFNFLNSAVEHVNQAQRLAGALATYPDILKSHVKEDCSSLQVVQVVVNSMPFSVKEPLEGVYFSDIAAINRFFSERHVHVNSVRKVGSDTVMHRVAVHDFWLADKPDADSFMRHLADPYQLRVMLSHMSAEPIGIHIGPKLYAYTRVPRRMEMTIESIASVAGLSADGIKDELEQVSASIAEVKARKAGA